MARLRNAIAGYDKTLAVPPFNAVMGKDGLLFKRSTLSKVLGFTLAGATYRQVVDPIVDNAIYVYQLLIAPAAGLSLSSFYLADDGATPAGLLGQSGVPMPLLANTPFVLPDTGSPWLLTGAGKGIRMYVPAAINASYVVSITYLPVPSGAGTI